MPDPCQVVRHGIIIIRYGEQCQKQQEQAEKMSDIRGEVRDINFGNQIRSYVMQPYTLVKDHRTNAEISNVGAVMDGNIDPFINAYLSMDAEAQKGKKAE